LYIHISNGCDVFGYSIYKLVLEENMTEFWAEESKGAPSGKVSAVYTSLSRKEWAGNLDERSTEYSLFSFFNQLVYDAMKRRVRRTKSADNAIIKAVRASRKPQSVSNDGS
jgi:hypothetical protein